MILRLVGNRSLNSIIPLTVAIFILCLVYGFDDSLSGVGCDARTFNSGVWEPLYGPCIDANDAWHHVVLVVHETSWSYYLDGEKVGNKEYFCLFISYESDTFVF